MLGLGSGLELGHGLPVTCPTGLLLELGMWPREEKRRHREEKRKRKRKRKGEKEKRREKIR